MRIDDVKNSQKSWSQAGFAAFGEGYSSQVDPSPHAETE